MSSPQTAAGTAPAPKPVGAPFIGLYALAMFGIWMSIMLPASVTLALRISQIDPEGKNVSYSIAAGVGTLVALIANPLFGRLSDRTRSRFGRRRPWIVVGLAGTIVGAIIIGLSGSFPMLLLGWIIMQAFVNAAIAATLAIVPDRVPVKQQGLVGALSGTASSAAVLVGVFFVQWFPTNVLAQFGLPVLVAVLFAGLLVAMFRDDEPAPADIEPFDFKEFFGSFYINPRTSPDFAKFLVALFLVACGMGVISTYTVYLLQDRVSPPEAELPGLITLAYVIPGVVAVLSAPVAGWLNDRTGRRKAVLGAAAVFIAAGILVLAFATTVPMFMIGLVLVAGLGTGIAYGSYIGFAVATMNDPATAARDLGVVNIALSLPYSVMPFIAPLLLGIGGGGSNYPALLIVSAVLTLLAFVPMLMVRSTR
ncbi:MFS transporter [Microbacterium arabinogalactanolyticum]|uniref:MFS transporter n=1 Tax=Microbacterium arabinogalactanolyticum TaxID=69365 RepID=UPI002553E4FA|nr:MFS transporter [Microbacterium arabinogalactanolyticum]GLC86293.1 MFS transporter [Microbacterium arabinogalactanolyticum]